MERESIAAVEGDEEQRGISKLPLDMKKLIFAKLNSIQSICGCRIVCKEWNSILSSHTFLSSLPAENPWLLVCGQENDFKKWQCMAYCFSTQKWRTISLSFLPNPKGGRTRDLLTTAQGLLLFRDKLLFRENTRPKLYVCNPLMRSYAEIEIGDVTGKCIYLVKGTNGEPYLVVCPYSRFISFQIYHYFQDSWRIKCQFAGEAGCAICADEMVECNGVLFWRGDHPTSIVGYNIQDGFIKPVTVAPLPFVILIHIVAYGSSLLVVDTFCDVSWIYRTGIIIWELLQDEEDKSLWKWKVLARIPPKDLPENLDSLWSVKCVCVGDYLYFSYLSGEDVFAYNLQEGFWQYLPPCKIYLPQMMMSFEPKLDLYRFLGKLE